MGGDKVAIINSIKSRFARNRADPSIPTGRQSVSGASVYGNKTLSPLRSRTREVLEGLRRIHEETDAIEYLRRFNADVSMAVWNFVRLANQGHQMHFYDLKTKSSKPEIEAEWTTFAARVNEISNAGLDGLIDQFHHSAYMLGAQGAEAEVNEFRTDIDEVHPIIPKTIDWEYERRGKRKLWIPYQQQFLEKVSLEKGKANFFWVPTDPMIDDPRGTLILTPVIQAIDFQMQILQDLQAVLHHQGWPRNDIAILLENTMGIMPPAVRGAGPEKQQEWLEQQRQNVEDAMRAMDPDSDYIHYDNIKIDMAKGASSGRSLDVRAINELVDIQTLSGAKQMAIFMNRNQGVTESWGTVQFLIFCLGIVAIQRGSKRLIEEIARLWLRVRGLQAIPHFQHNPVDWNSEEQRIKVKLMHQQYWAIAQLMNWVDGDKAAQESVGAEKAAGEPSQNVRVSLSAGGGVDVGGKGSQTPQKAGGRRRTEEASDEDD